MHSKMMHMYVESSADTKVERGLRRKGGRSEEGIGDPPTESVNIWRGGELCAVFFAGVCICEYSGEKNLCTH